MGDQGQTLSDAERLSAAYPEAAIFREVLDDGTHGDWVAELTVQLRGLSPAALRSALARVMSALHMAARADTPTASPLVTGQGMS